MFHKKQKIITRKRGGSRNEENLLFYDYIAAPLDVWQWQIDVTPEMNKSAMTDLLAAVGRAKELFPFAKCVSVQDGGSWGRNGYCYPPDNAKALGRLELVEKVWKQIAGTGPVMSFTTRFSIAPPRTRAFYSG